MYKKLLAALAVVGILTLAGCGDGPQPTYPDLDPALSGEYVANFADGEAEEVFASDGWANSDDPAFNAVWKKENLSYSDGQMHLSIKDEKATTTIIDKETEEEIEVTYPHTAGEARTHHLYGYGDFMVKMKPTNVPGSVSTFFTFTYSGDKINGVENKWDEIDIEFLGKDTTKVQFNYFVGGVGGHEYNYRLGFDASKEFHEYGFRWEEDRISWVIDGKTVHVVTGTRDTLPSCPGRILTSYWPCHPNSSGWGGYFAGATDDTVDYEWIKSSATGIYADGEEPVLPFDEDVDWDKIDPVDTSFENGWGNDYKIEKESEYITNVTYESVDGWNHIISKDAARYAKHADTVKVTLKNNSSTDVAARVDVKGENDVPTGEESHTDILNLRAYSNVVDVTTNLEWGGSSFTLPGNEEVTVVMNYDNASEDIGAPTALLFLLDSMQDGRTEHPGSSVTIKDIKFANLDGTPVEPDPKPEPQPTGEVDWDKVEATALTFWASNPSIYSFEDNGSTAVTVNYADAVGYACIGADNANEVANANNMLKVSLRNNGDHAVDFRMDVQVTGGDSKILSAEAEGHNEVRVSGGSAFITVAVNEEVDLIVGYDATLGVGNVMFFVDSMGDAPASGSVTISNAKFAKAEEPAPAEVDWDKIEANALTFWASNPNIYSFEDNGSTAVTVNYADATGYACIGTDSANSVIDANNTAKVTLRNNGDHAVDFRMDVQVTGGDSAIISALAEGHNEVRVSEGSAFITVAVNESVDLLALYDATLGANNLLFFIDSMGDAPASGSVTISDVKFADISEEQSGIDWDKVAAEDITFATDDWTGYYGNMVKDETTGATTVTYEWASGWANVNADVETAAAGKNAIQLKLKNELAEASVVRVDIKSASEAILNVRSEATGHEDDTHPEWTYGSRFTLAGNEELVVVIYYEETQESGVAHLLQIYLDSEKNESDKGGKVTISDVKFAK